MGTIDKGYGIRSVDSRESCVGVGVALHLGGINKQSLPPRVIRGNQLSLRPRSRLHEDGGGDPVLS